MWATVQRNAIFVENAEHGATAMESTVFPDVFDGMATVVHVDNSSLSFLTGFR